MRPRRRRPPTGLPAGPVSGPRASFGAFVHGMEQAQRLVVQPRMGMSDPREMRRGLLATKQAAATTVGTITLDSYTRVGAHDSARNALQAGAPLNGYPIVAHDTATTTAVIEGIGDASFPIQVRHGSAAPEDIFRALVALGLDATEGGPLSYCLPYSRRPVRDSVESWARCTELFGRLRHIGREPHLETFGGCMLGQLCPPSLLVAISVLEAMFFREHGVRSISLSYAQQTNHDQDVEAIWALRRLAGELLPDVRWHVVLYAYMGVYPKTPEGARHLLEEAARLAVRAGAARLIVKTEAEAHRIPTIEENVRALQTAAAAAQGHAGTLGGSTIDTGLYTEARTLVEAVVDLHPRLDRALVLAFERGYLDVPYCLHPDNRGDTRSCIASDGRLAWSRVGRLPIPAPAQPAGGGAITSTTLLSALSYVADKCDALALDPAVDTVLTASPGS